MSTITQAAARRRRIVTRGAPLAVVAAIAFAGGVIVGGDDPVSAAERFVAAWERGDYVAMHAELTRETKAEYSPQRLERAFEDAARTATVIDFEAGEVHEGGEGDVAKVGIEFRTHAFGELGGELALPVSDDGVAWEPHLGFPGLAPGERLSRRTRAPERAPILAADGSPLAEGPAAARSLPLGDAAANVVGAVGAATGAQDVELAAHGFPPGSLAGNSGLELAYDQRLAGQPGGQLLAVSAAQESSLSGGRILATSEPRRGKAVRTTIDPELQQAAVTALGGLYGGVAVLDARNGSVLALAGLAYSAPQPPGSTFKIITATAALDAGIVKLSDEFPVEVSNSEIGREISNAHDSPCGGSFAETFAESCNTVFAPLGAEVGGEGLVETAERFGFNQPPALFDPQATAIVDPPASTIPTTLESSVETGESAIGQGQVLATPLQLASMAQAISAGGVRSPTPIARGPMLQPDAEPVRVTSKETAATMRELMIGVVTGGTGIAAALPGVQVAGKTGTAELGPAPLAPGQKLAPGEEPPMEQDAWFTAFAPAADPSLAVAVMIVDAAGDGGTIAAPIARQVLATGLGVG